MKRESSGCTENVWRVYIEGECGECVSVYEEGECGECVSVYRGRVCVKNKDKEYIHKTHISLFRYTYRLLSTLTLT